MTFKENDLVLHKILPHQLKTRAIRHQIIKIHVVIKAFLRRVLILTRMDEMDLVRLVNSNFVKKYFHYNIKFC
jgi:hypothetical protein